jgi:hypothetical protein
MSMSESATGCVVRGLLVEGSSGEGRALPAAGACSLFSCCVLALHRREAPLRSAGSPAYGPAPHAANNRITGKWSAFMCSHIPKIGRQAPVTLRYSDLECRRSVLNLRLRNCPSPYSRTLTWRSTSSRPRPIKNPQSTTRLDERRTAGVENRNCEPFQPRPRRPPAFSNHGSRSPSPSGRGRHRRPRRGAHG